MNKKPKEIIKYNKAKWRHRVLISVATEGWIRFEWAHARYGQIIPVNWSAAGFDIAYTAVGYSVEDAYNVIAKQALQQDAEWLITIEDDVLIPPDTLVKFAKYIDEKKTPVVSGLYFTKGNPSEPLIFRGRGNGIYDDWKLGQKVWADGLPMGCLLIHCSILKYMWDNSEEYVLPDGEKTRKIFETPRSINFDMLTGAYERKEGTQDLYFFNRLMDEQVLKKTGWPEIGKKKYPFLCDTTILCKHIDRATGKQYP